MPFSPATFTDRSQPIALFNQLRGRPSPEAAWPLLPFLTFLGPAGTGKSTLIQYLLDQVCSFPETGATAVPAVRIDFTAPSAPHTYLDILVALRNRLQDIADNAGRHLTFPRFDLAAAFALAATTSSGLQPPADHIELNRILYEALPRFQSLHQLGNNVANVSTFMGCVRAAVQFGRSELSAFDYVCTCLERGDAWRWYPDHHSGVAALRSATGIEDVLRTLHALCSDERKRADVVEDQILPAALVADLCAALDAPVARCPWGSQSNAVVFLDGFEALLDGTPDVAHRLLAGFTLPRRTGTDPLLVVLGSKRRIFDPTADAQNPSFDDVTAPLDDDPSTVQVWAESTYDSWLAPIQDTSKRQKLDPARLALPCWLPDFGPDHAQVYLDRLGAQYGLTLFPDAAVRAQLHALTHGHPLFLALAADAELAGAAFNKRLTLETLAVATTSVDVVPGHADEPIDEYLADVFLSQISEQERRAFPLLAAPRVLSPAVIRVALDLPSEQDALALWRRYGALTFVSTGGPDHLVLHPVVRALLHRRLTHGVDPTSSTSDSYRVHSRLGKYFKSLAMHLAANVRAPASSFAVSPAPTHESPADRARIEAAYHALCLGDPEAALDCAREYQPHESALWASVLAASDQATAILPPTGIMQLVDVASARVMSFDHQDAEITAVLTAHWLLAVYTLEASPVDWAGAQNNLGHAWAALSTGDRAQNLEDAIASFKRALTIFTRETYPGDWAGVQTNLGSAYTERLRGDRVQNVEDAMVCFEQAAMVYTHVTAPLAWASVQNNLGNAYRKRLRDTPEQNLEKAIKCFQNAARVRAIDGTRQAWATTQNDLGNAYRDRVCGDPDQNIEDAIACYQQALTVYIREADQWNWAGVQENLGIAYCNRMRGDRAQNLEEAISCFKNALSVYNADARPRLWASVQRHLGRAFRQRLREDRAHNLEEAVTCYQRALEIYNLDTLSDQWVMTTFNLGYTYIELVREAHLRSDPTSCRSHRIAAIRAFRSLLSLPSLDMSERDRREALQALAIAGALPCPES